MIGELSLLVLRLLFVVTLYLFLVLVVVLIWRDLRAHSPEPPAFGGPALRVVESARSGLRRGSLLPVPPEATIGRAADNQIVLPDDTVSSHHALLCRRDGRWWLEDLGSTNGTRVNGRVVSSQTVVTPGDLLEFGAVRLRLEDGQ